MNKNLNNKKNRPQNKKLQIQALIYSVMGFGSFL